MEESKRQFGAVSWHITPYFLSERAAKTECGFPSYLTRICSLNNFAVNVVIFVVFEGEVLGQFLHKHPCCFDKGRGKKKILNISMQSMR